MMEAFFSAADKVFGTSGWVEVAGGTGAPPSVEGGCPPDSGAVLVFGTVSGWGPNSR